MKLIVVLFLLVIPNIYAMQTEESVDEFVKNVLEDTNKTTYLIEQKRRVALQEQQGATDFMLKVLEHPEGAKAIKKLIRPCKNYDLCGFMFGHFCCLLEFSNSKRASATQLLSIFLGATEIKDKVSVAQKKDRVAMANKIVYEDKGKISPAQSGVHVISSCNKSLLDIAVKFLNIPLVKVLLQSGADPSKVVDDSSPLISVLDLESNHSERIELFELLQNHKVKPVFPADYKDYYQMRYTAFYENFRAREVILNSSDKIYFHRLPGDMRRELVKFIDDRLPKKVS